MPAGLDEQAARAHARSRRRPRSEELLEERNLGFLDGSEQKKFYFERLKRGDRGRRASHKCMYPSCANRSVPRSHTLPRSGPIHRIAENGHVLTTDFDKTTGRLKAALIGVREASTFPGFCADHEALFHEFEKRKDLSTPRDHTLQFFRLVCREIRTRELQVATMRELATDHQQLLDSRGMERLCQLLAGC